MAPPYLAEPAMADLLQVQQAVPAQVCRFKQLNWRQTDGQTEGEMDSIRQIGLPNQAVRKLEENMYTTGGSIRVIKPSNN